MPALRFALALASLTACAPVAPTTADTSTGTIDPTTAAPDPTTDSTSTTDNTPPTAGEPSAGTPLTADTVDFILGPDIPEECDVFEQDCPADQKCMPYAQGGGSAWNATRCVPVTGDGLAGDPCIAMDGGISGHDDCALGHVCWDLDERLNGTCTAQCTGSPMAPECPEASFCYSSGDSVVNLCIPICDPLASDCPEGKVCLHDTWHFTCYFDQSGDAGQLNDPCEHVNACDPGLVCINSGAASSACSGDSTGCCTPYCKLPDASCPNPDQQCLPWSDRPSSPDTEHIGVCAVPR